MEQIERTPPRDRLAITADCPGCGRINIPIRNVHLWRENDGVSSYSFICPGCCGFVRSPADAGTMGVLLVVAPPLGHEDLEGFRNELERGDWFHRFERTYASTFQAGCDQTRRGSRRKLSKLAGALIRHATQRHRLFSS